MNLIYNGIQHQLRNRMYVPLNCLFVSKKKATKGHYRYGTP